MKSQAARPIIALEVGPLGERHHTGIANVTKCLARELLADESVEGRFFFNRGELPRAAMAQIVQMEGGEILWWLASRFSLSPEPPYAPDAPVIGIYTSHKWQRRLFPVEVQLVHDLTTLVTPWFHTSESIDHWSSRLLGDMLSSDLIVSVSQSTDTDLRAYYPQLAHIPAIVATLAATNQHQDAAEPPRVEPYIVVLGTLEPRKNVEMVLELLGSDPSLLAAARFIFVGRLGWSTDVHAVMARHRLDEAVRAGRIVLTGFVSDATRDGLISHARAVLYVSQYEGFGLPILEALRAGVPVITGYGSSLPEAGGDVAVYCDVAAPSAIGDALHQVLAAQQSDDAQAARRRRMAWAENFQWSTTYRKIRDAAISIAGQL